MNEFANHEVAPIKLKYEQFYDRCNRHSNLSFIQCIPFKLHAMSSNIFHQLMS